eukprot:COSAG01_NODE_439_length_17034_cov_5.326484_12_plen_86_part_00
MDSSTVPTEATAPASAPATGATPYRATVPDTRGGRGRGGAYLDIAIQLHGHLGCYRRTFSLLLPSTDESEHQNSLSSTPDRLISY